MINLKQNKFPHSVYIIFTIFTFICCSNKKDDSRSEKNNQSFNYGRLSQFELKKDSGNNYKIVFLKDYDLDCSLQLLNDTAFIKINNGTKTFSRPLFIKNNYSKIRDTILFNDKRDKKIFFDIMPSVKFNDIAISELIISEIGSPTVSFNFVYSFQDGILQVSAEDITGVDILYMFPTKTYKRVSTKSNFNFL
jgi:hypothetical protein